MCSGAWSPGDSETKKTIGFLSFQVDQNESSHPQTQFPVDYDGELIGTLIIGTLIPDLIVDQLVIVDPKVATAFHGTHMAPMLGYVNTTNLSLALLLNFKNAKLDWKRVARKETLNHSGNPIRIIRGEKFLTTDFTDDMDQRILLPGHHVDAVFSLQKIGSSTNEVRECARAGLACFVIIVCFL